MAGNHLEALVAEWYEVRGYFVRRNVRVGRRFSAARTRSAAIRSFSCSLVAYSPPMESVFGAPPRIQFQRRRQTRIA